MRFDFSFLLKIFDLRRHRSNQILSYFSFLLFNILILVLFFLCFLLFRPYFSLSHGDNLSLSRATQSNLFPKLTSCFHIETHKVSTSIGGGSTSYHTSHVMKRFIPHVHRAGPQNGFENGSTLAENRVEYVSLTSSGWGGNSIFSSSEPGSAQSAKVTAKWGYAGSRMVFSTTLPNSKIRKWAQWRPYPEILLCFSSNPRNLVRKVFLGRRSWPQLQLSDESPQDFARVFSPSPRWCLVKTW